MSNNPLDFIKNNDEDLFSDITSARNSAFAEGILSVKDKILIALALDAAHGSVNGVKSLGQQAIAAGATKDEIFEALRVVYYISGVGSIYTSIEALNEIL